MKIEDEVIILKEMVRCAIFQFSAADHGLQIMRSAGVYLIQAEIGTIRNAVIPAGDILITLRVGRSSAYATHPNPTPTSISQLNLSAVIQLNVDSTALDTQRCSISFNGNDKKIIGIALISLPRDKSLLQNTFRLTQNEDRRAQVEIRIKITPFDMTPKTVIIQQIPTQTSINIVNDQSRTSDGLLPKPNNSNRLETSSNNPQNNAAKSKISQEFSYVSSQDRKTPKSFKVREEDKVVQTTQSEMKRIREEKQAYYQLYQIQKSKNEVATKFINNILKKITDKHPNLLTVIENEPKKIVDTTNPILSLDKKTPTKSQQQHAESAMVAQLEQANRSLHRQVEEYKKLVEQLKGDLSRNNMKGDIPLQSKASNNFLLPGIFDFPITKSNIKENKSNIKSASAISSAIKEEEKKGNNWSEIDFKKWLEMSIGQREEIQGLLGNLTQKPAEGMEKNEKILKKLKASLDKSFAALLGRKDLTRDALMVHKKEVNRCFEEIVSF